MLEALRADPRSQPLLARTLTPLPSRCYLLKFGHLGQIKHLFTDRVGLTPITSTLMTNLHRLMTNVQRSETNMQRS